MQLLCLIGEAFEDLGEDVCGAVVNLRPKGDKLGLWTADTSHIDCNMRIGSVPVFNDESRIVVDLGLVAHQYLMLNI